MTTNRPKRPRGRMTAAEHEAWLKETGQYEPLMERLRQQDEEREKRAAEWRRAETPLVEELRAAGYAVNSAWDLVNTSTPYRSALPILLAHLPRPYPGPVREGIARALAVPDTKDEGGWPLLTRLFRDETEKRPKDALAVAIAAAADDDVIEEVIGLARDTRYGTTRVLLLRALERSADPRARAALMELGTDPDLKQEIQVILKRLKRANASSRSKKRN